MLGVSLSAIGLMLFTRLMELCSFFKLSSHDFTMIVAIGSILASMAISETLGLRQRLFAVAILFLVQGVVRSIAFQKKSKAIILVAHDNYFGDNLKEANLATSDVQEVLRKNGIKSKTEVFAVIMEITGDMSVIKNNELTPDWGLFNDVPDSELLLTTGQCSSQ